jgi:hypothetical protein
MMAIVEELERILTRLKPEAAERLETQVRGILFSVSDAEAVLPTLEEMKRRRPEFADLIGSLADVEFELSPERPLSPDKD